MARFIVVTDESRFTVTVADDSNGSLPPEFDVIVVDTLDRVVVARFYRDAEDGTKYERATRLAVDLERSER